MKPASKERFPDLDKYQRKNVAILEERCRYLAERIDSDDCSQHARPYLKDERDALAWALTEVAACHAMAAV